MSTLDHEHWMRHALDAARNSPALPFGAVIVRRDTAEIAARGWNRASDNPTWHGEIDALNALSRSGFTGHPGDLVLYTTAEPCPMCMAAAFWSGIGTVVFGTSIDVLQASGWRQIDIHADEVVRRAPGWRCTVVGGVLEQECDALFAGGPPGA
jgi:tRNA(Arg) A34 adenosine deaminase TadA